MPSAIQDQNEKNNIKCTGPTIQQAPIILNSSRRVVKKETVIQTSFLL